MEELLKKINGNLIEIKSKQDRDTFHISGGEGNIGQQNYIFVTSNNTFIEILKSLFIKPILNKKTMLELSVIQFLFLISTRILFYFFILSCIFIPLFYPSNNYVGMLVIIFAFFISSFVIGYRLFYLKEIPNDKTIETIKDARTNKNMTKVNLEDLKS